MRTICVDIDGTISHYIEWVDSSTFGEVLPHCAEVIHHLKANGWFVIIYTTRSDRQAISDFLTSNNIPFDAINENPNQPENAIGGKPIADVYLDDRAIQFDGHWETVYEKIECFKPWEEHGGVSEVPPSDYSKAFMLEDFSQCMETHRHYDSVNWDITKFTFGEILVAIGACWTIYTIEDTDTEAKWLTMAIICFASLLFSMLSLYTIIKNRTYFVLTSRHINELRYHVIASRPMGFENKSNFWVDYQFPKVKDYRSTQFISIYLIGFLSIVLSLAFSVSLMNWLSYEVTWLCVVAPIILSLTIITFLIISVGKEVNSTSR